MPFFIFLFECKHALPFQPVPVATGMSTAVPLLFENGQFPSFVTFEKIDWYAFNWTIAKLGHKLMVSHNLRSYVSLQLSYDDVSTKVVIATQYFLMTWTVIFLSSHWHMHLRTTSQIHVLSVDSAHSHPIYLLHSPSTPKSILPPLLPGNWVSITLTITITLIDR